MSAEQLPEELKCFNWGAFLLNWVWGIMHKKYITLLILLSTIIPVIGPLAMSIWFGLKGNEWAWNSREWNSIKQFNEAQQNWVRIWFILFIFGTIITFKILFILIIAGSH